VAWTTDRTAIDVRTLASRSWRRAVSGSNDDRKRELECLRLASDLMALAQHHPNPDLKVHCVAMAKFWSGEAVGKPARNDGKNDGIEHVGIQSVLLH
jgi:hypothetical protein